MQNLHQLITNLKKLATNLVEKEEIVKLLAHWKETKIISNYSVHHPVGKPTLYSLHFQNPSALEKFVKKVSGLNFDDKHVDKLKYLGNFHFEGLVDIKSEQDLNEETSYTITGLTANDLSLLHSKV